MSTIGSLPPLGSTHGDVAHVSAHRFGIAAGMSGWDGTR